jgi:nucleoside-triphosphatase
MPNNVLLTGAPRSGKTTVVERVLDGLAERGLTAGGIYSPEIREEGERVGFEIVDLHSNEAAVMAHVDFEDGPSVGKYRVDVGNIEAICEPALSWAIEEADVVVIDEIAPMEVESEVFVAAVGGALDAPEPVLAVVHQRSTAGFIGAVKDRPDIELFEVTTDTRDQLPDRLLEWIAGGLGG